MSDSERNSLLPRTFPRVPKDRFFLVYVIFYLLGIGTLLPWNFFSNARQYYTYKLRNMSSHLNTSDYEDPNNQTQLQVMFESYLTIAAMLPNILFMFLNTAATKLISLKVRINLAAIITILLFFLAVVLAKVNTNNWQIPFFAVTMVSIVIMNAGSAVLQGGIFGLSGLFPKRYTQAVMGGMGMGGILAAVSNIFVIHIGSDPVESGFWYFLIAEIFIVLALLGFWMLPFLKFSRYHTEELKSSQDMSVNSDNFGTTSSDLGNIVQSEPHNASQTPVSSNEIRGPSELDNSAAIVVRTRTPNLTAIFNQIWMYAFIVFFTFFITLSCYPAINSNIVSQYWIPYNYHPWADKYFTPVSCFLFFNVFDWIGRTIAGPLQWPKEGSPLIPIAALCRLVFIPLFLMCNVQPRNNLLPVFFHEDWIPMTLMVVFATSNGYLGTLSMMYGPRRVHFDDVESAGSMMSFFLSLGLGMGSLLSFALLNVIAWK